MEMMPSYDSGIFTVRVYIRHPWRAKQRIAWEAFGISLSHNLCSVLLLNCYGIRGIALDWFSSYLTNRSQTVIHNEQESEMKETLCGVPQGSILGPLLFLLYINDLPSVSNLFMPILFADDTNLFCNEPNLDELIEKINEELKLIYKWVNVNKLSLNIEKTNFMLFTP